MDRQCSARLPLGETAVRHVLISVIKSLGVHYASPQHLQTESHGPATGLGSTAWSRHTQSALAHGNIYYHSHNRLFALTNSDSCQWPWPMCKLTYRDYKSNSEMCLPAGSHCQTYRPYRTSLSFDQKHSETILCPWALWTRTWDFP